MGEGGTHYNTPYSLCQPSIFMNFCLPSWFVKQCFPKIKQRHIFPSSLPYIMVIKDFILLLKFITYIQETNYLPRDGFQHKSLELKLNISEVLKNAWAHPFLRRVKARSAWPPGFAIYRRLDLSLITYGTFDLKYLNIERELQLGLFVNSSTQVTRLPPLLYMLKCPPSSSTTKLSIYLVIKHSKHHSPSWSGSIHNPSVCLLCT